MTLYGYPRQGYVPIRHSLADIGLWGGVIHTVAYHLLKLTILILVNTVSINTLTFWVYAVHTRV